MTNASLAVAGDCIAQARPSCAAARAWRPSPAHAWAPFFSRAQGFELRSRAAERGAAQGGWDAARTTRLGGFGLFFYGPVMHYWYGALNAAFPVDRAWPLAAKLSPFLVKARAPRLRGSRSARRVAHARLCLRFRACACFRPQVALNQLVLGPVVVTAVFAWSLGWSRRLSEFPAKWRRDTLPTLRKGWAFWVPASSINFAFVPIQFQVLYMSACGIVWTTILSAASATKA